MANNTNIPNTNITRNNPNASPQEQVTKADFSTSSWLEVQKSVVDIRNIFGLLPDFVNYMPEQSIPGAWKEVQNLSFNPQTALELKIKDLIGLAVAAQIPCEMLAHFNRISSLADGASEQEQSEAFVMSAITRHWSTVLNGLQLDKTEFRKEADQIMNYVKKMMEDSGGKMPPEKDFLVNFSTPAETYQDMQKTLGLVPRFFKLFPEEGIAGAWSEFKGIQLNPYTQLSGKHKELIGLSVAAQIPCDYCIYFHKSAASLYGANDREIQEAIGQAAVARHWSAIFHGAPVNPENFAREADQMVQSSHRQQLHS